MGNKRKQSSGGSPGTDNFAEFKGKRYQATTTEFLQLTFTRNSFNVLDYSTDCFALSLTDKHGLNYEG